VLNDKVEVVAYTYNATGYTGVAYSNTPTTNYLTKWTSTGTIGNSSIFDNGTQVGINTASPSYVLDVQANNATFTSRIINLNTSTDSAGLLVQAGVNAGNEIALFRNAAGTARMGIYANGNVGIGNASPTALLDVYLPSVGTYFRGGSDNVARQLKISSSTTTNAGDTHTFDAQSGTGNLVFATTSTERMRITAAGSILAGSQTEYRTDLSNIRFSIFNSSSNPTLSITNTTNGVGQTASIYFGQMINNGTDARPGGSIKSIAVGTYTGGVGTTYSADLAFYTSYQNSDTERMRISSDGSIGFNISTLGSRSFSFQGISGRPLVIEAIENAGVHSIMMRPNNSGYNLISSNYLSGGTYLPLSLSGRENTSDFVLTNTGLVLIGTTTNPSPYGKVTIRALNSGLTIQDASTNGYRAIYPQSGALYFYNGTNEGYLSSGGTWVNASDITIKKDIKEIEYGLKEVMELKPKWYRMIEDDLEQIGFIAQDVEEVLPELVSTSQRGMKGLSYGQLNAVLVKAIQEQQSQISAQSIEIENLKKLIN
jgi:hypothetical protein